MEEGRAGRARLSLGVAGVALVLLVAVAGSETWGLLGSVLLGCVVALVGAWLALSRRGAVRGLGVALALAAPIAVAVLLVVHGLLWAVLVTAVLLALAYEIGRSALPVATSVPVVRRAVTAARHPYLIINPRSGDGAAERAGLAQRAEQLGIDVFVLSGPEHVDVAALAEQAIQDGHDVIGVAGGDGTQALVAAVAAAHDVELLVVPAGTRNHFARDLGLDITDVCGSLDALADGVEVRVDLGDVNGRPFVNNVSFGAYAEIVENDDYREAKLKVSARVLPSVLHGDASVHLSASADGHDIAEPQVLLVSNNSYATSGRRLRLDEGVLGIIGVKLGSARDAVRLLRGSHSPDIIDLTAQEVVVDATSSELPVGIDGESVHLETPVRCRLRPAALRVRLPSGLAPPPPVRTSLTLGHLVAAAKGQ